MRRDDLLQTLSAFRQDRQEEFGIVRIGVLGSASRDQIADGSDIDVVVELADTDLLTLVGVKQELESVPSRPVDIVRYREKMNAFLTGRLDQEAVYVRSRARSGDLRQIHESARTVLRKDVKSAVRRVVYPVRILQDSGRGSSTQALGTALDPRKQSEQRANRPRLAATAPKGICNCSALT